MAGSDIDCVVIGEGGHPLEETLHSLTTVSYFRGKVHSYVVGGAESETVASRFPEVTFIAEPSGNRAKQRNLGWDAGDSPFVQFLESGDRINPEWFQRATKEVERGVAAVCGRIEPSNPDRNRWHRIAYLESRIDLEEGRLLDVEPLLRREILEETGGFNESLSKGGALEFNARLASKGRRVVHLDFPMADRRIDIPNWKAYWQQGVRSGYRIGGASSKRKGLALFKDPIIRGLSAIAIAFVAVVGLLVTTLALFLLVPAAILLLRPRIFEAERVATQEGFSHEDATLYTWHRSLFVVPQLWGMIGYYFRLIFA